MDDEQENGEREADYERARGILPGLLKSGWWRECALASVAALLLAYVLVSSWRSSSQLSECKAEKQTGWVVVLDANGDRLGVPAVSAAEWRLTDGMVAEKLVRVVRCLRGLDPVPKVVSACWRESAPLFFGAESVAKFEAYNKARFPTVDAILQQQARESIVITGEVWDKPEPDAPSRFWMRWVETHRLRTGELQTPEAWSVTFDVELVPVGKTAVDSGLRIIRWGDWRRVASKGGA